MANTRTEHDEQVPDGMAAATKPICVSCPPCWDYALGEMESIEDETDSVRS